MMDGFMSKTVHIVEHKWMEKFSNVLFCSGILINLKLKSFM